MFDVNQLDDGGTPPQTIPITSNKNPYYSFFRSESNPFIAEFITSQNALDQYGIPNLPFISGGTQVFEKYENLAILETAATVSRLDLYYETSTSGLISILNAAISSGGTGGGSADRIVDFNYNHNEGMAPGTDISGTFYFENFGGAKLTGATATLNYVRDDTGSGVDLSSQFYLDDTLGNGDFILRTASTANGSSADAYFYYGSNPLNRQYTFEFDVTAGGSTVTLPISGNLSNVDPIINNSNTNPIEVGTGESVIISALDGYNGSNTSNPDTTTYTQELSWSINQSSVVGEGIFSISQDGTQVLNSNASAAGTSLFELNLQDAGGASATPKTFIVYFGQPQVPTDFISSRNFNDGDGGAIWFTDNVTGLSTNPPDFGSSIGSVFLNGFQAPSYLDNILTNYVCGPSATFAATFANQTTATGLTQGTFYVIVQGTNTFKPQLGILSDLDVSFAIQYRASASDPNGWSYLADLNGNTISGTNVGGQWRYDNFKEGLYTNGGNIISSSVFANWPDPFVFGRATKVFAFNTVGEYRIVYGNLSSSFGEFNAGVACNQAGQQNLKANGKLETGDFYYPSFQWSGDNDGVYEYRVNTSSTSCGSNFGSGTAYYAAEPFAKYVTQLYTNTSLLTPANVNGTARFRRMDQRGSSAVSNPEQTKDGAYTATFSSGNRTSDSTPCTF